METLLYYGSNALAYAEYGEKSGFPILVQHGMIASIKDGALFQRLADHGARVICIARPGYGESSPCEMRSLAEWGEIVSVLVEQLELARFDVLGISSGAPYSYAIAHQLPRETRNLFILSGTPALFDAGVLAHWPYPVNPQAILSELQTLAFDLFFAGCSPQQLATDDIRDSMRNHCFGIAQDLRIRCNAWGFNLMDVKAPVHMRHSRADQNVPLITAELTAAMLPDCRLEVRENDAHFSQEVLNDFIETTLASSN
jgi:pimeloyl-ACP methyl ester carboxylesterase